MDKNFTEQKRQPASADDTKGPVKKPYVKPEVRHERVFETLALSCGKIAGASKCHFTTKRS